MKQSRHGFVGVFSFLPVFLFVFGVLAGSGASSPARAENAVYEKWQVYMGNSNCQVSLRRWEGALEGFFDSAGDCPSTLRAVKSFTFTDERREHLILFADEQMQTMIGDASVNGSGILEGMIGDGETLLLQPLEVSDIGVAQEEQDDVDCRFYAHDETCASANDDQILSISGFDKVFRWTLVEQQAYAFSKQRGFANSQRVPQGACVQVTRCEWDDAKLIKWCEVRYNNNMMSGYIRQRDVNYVYLAEGC
jgi:hypothetical protein